MHDRESRAVKKKAVGFVETSKIKILWHEEMFGSTKTQSITSILCSQEKRDNAVSLLKGQSDKIILNVTHTFSNCEPFFYIANTYRVSLNLQEDMWPHLCQCNLMLGPLLKKYNETLMF